MYRQLHDAFGTREWSGRLNRVMKDLIALRERQRG
jgi:L-ribulokinase